MGRLGVESSFGPEVRVHDGFAVRQPTEEGNVKRDAVGCDHALSACVWEEWSNEHDDARNQQRKNQRFHERILGDASERERGTAGLIL